MAVALGLRWGLRGGWKGRGRGEEGGLWADWGVWRGVFAPPPSQHPSSHFVGQLVVLARRQVAVGTDGGAVVLVAGGQEGQAVGEQAVAGRPVGLGSFVLALAQLTLAQGLQHVAAHLQQHDHTETESHTESQFVTMSRREAEGRDPPGCFFLTATRPALWRSQRPSYQRRAAGTPSSSQLGERGGHIY